MVGKMDDTNPPTAQTPRLLIGRYLDQPAQARAAVASGVLHRIRPGVFIDAEDWDHAFWESRARIMTEALLDQSRGAPIVLAYGSAAAHWRLPLLRTRLTRVHVLQTHARAQSTRHVMRHNDDIDPADIVWIEPGRLGVTSLDRTVYDMLRTLPGASAVALGDHALRAVALRDGADRLDVASADSFRALLAARVSAGGGARHIRRARFVVPFLDPRAESVGESASRLLLHALGYAPPRLQVPVPGPRGETYRLDFGLEGAWGEFAGLAKYSDPRMLHGRTPQQALRDEKEREDWIRGSTGLPVVRWTFDDLDAPAALGRRLARFGLFPSSPPRSHPFGENTPKWM